MLTRRRWDPYFLPAMPVPARVASEMLFPKGGEKQIDSGFMGVLGAFEVYRGSIGGHRMANLRIILR